MSTNTEAESVSATSRYRDLINEALDGYTCFGSGCPQRLTDAIRYMLLSPGKRIRPLLTLFATEACDCKIEESMPAACGVEMIHCYTLIHDDLPSMDNDDLRRGQLTCHKKFDEATAILAGDALQTLAFEVIARGVNNKATECIVALASASGAESLVGGQIDDLAGLTSQSGIEQLENIHRRKTAALLAVSLELGGIIANASEEQRNSLSIFGKNLGLAFQIVDDLLDYCGDVTKMGKHTGQDQQNGTVTFPMLLGEDASRRRARSLIEDALQRLEVFGRSADQLRQVAAFVIDRDF